MRARCCSTPATSANLVKRDRQSIRGAPGRDDAEVFQGRDDRAALLSYCNRAFRSKRYRTLTYVQGVVDLVRLNSTDPDSSYSPECGLATVQNSSTESSTPLKWCPRSHRARQSRRISHFLESHIEKKKQPRRPLRLRTRPSPCHALVGDALTEAAPPLWPSTSFPQVVTLWRRTYARVG